MYIKKKALKPRERLLFHGREKMAYMYKVPHTIQAIFNLRESGTRAEKDCEKWSVKMHNTDLEGPVVSILCRL